MTTPAPDTATGQIVPFATVLQQINNGQAHATASALLQDLVRAVVATGRKGTLTMTVEVAPAGKAGGAALVTTVKTTSKPPMFDDPDMGMFFHDEEGNLLRDDPRQERLPLRQVGTAERGETA